MPTSPLTQYLVVQHALDQQVLASLRVANTNISRELVKFTKKAGIGAAVRSEQLLRTQQAMHAEMGRLWTRVGDQTRTSQSVAAAAAAQTMLDGSESVLASLFSEADRALMAASARAQAARSVEVLRERLSGTSHKPLSEAVYDQAALSSGKIDDIVNNAIARGASAVDLARDVRAFVNPNTPGGVRYAAMRLGRTELNNAFHAAQVREAQQSPFIEGVKWELSGSHPVPDECNRFAEQEHVTGWEEGVFRPEEVPSKPHPNCLCYTIPVTVDQKEFLKAFQEGKYDRYLSQHGVSKDGP